ncbi:Transmembrane amino acid transporter protein [Trichomonas vaginalis G3]|uniref:Transmembrane amino acid transporter protein n=1 Tax=Trichomonas vaginalis (strain ATCC PRA-98 / G3) TaxID=412133 RepID=A2FT01_TRIV3|nr:amino acid transmembrane transporter protein [Trichomonas vaginalis G3]EAX91966.1 Transmembrane amino acid transporter protein [Trichomonas vaginalis G3]KAI5513682.1 amino acid transmembrane transporter protein [Trichomonas vaginalis G3]|eukprot:XP_001304896.1 Transmembrane amino acid transporter protein [Trichomonas vaginalis G3]
MIGLDSEPLVQSLSSSINPDNYLDEKIYQEETPSDSRILDSVQILCNTAIGSGTLMVPYCYTSGVGSSLLMSLLFAFIGFATLSFFCLASHFTKTYDYNGLFTTTFGKGYVWIVQTMIFLVQFGSCIIYCHWIGRLVPKTINHDDDPGILGNHVFWILIFAAVFVFPLVCLKSIKYLQNLAYLSSACIILLIIHAGYWFIYGQVKHTVDISEKIVWFKFSPVLITCMSVYSMGFNCHMNLYPTLEHQKEATFRKGVKIAFFTDLVVYIVYNVFGIFTYLYLFDNLKNGSALEAYTQTNILTNITVGGIVFVMILSVPIVIWAARISINDMFWGNQPTTMRWILMAFFLTAGSAGFAASSDNVIFFFDIVGGLFTPALIFLLPCLFYLLNQHDEPFWRIFVACCICIFTVIVTIACTYQAILEVVNAFKNK